MSEYKKSVLPGGLRVVSETLPYARSVSLGVWVAAGSRDEELRENGLAHLIEHMVFKGTKHRDALKIAQEIDFLGGRTNAFTSKEHTCFHTRVLPEHLPEAVDLLADIMNNSRFDEEELALEKQVIIQEIAMVEDSPEELVSEIRLSKAWAGNSLGRPVAGTFESVAALKREDILSYLNRHYGAARMVVSAAGAVEHDHLVKLAEGQGWGAVSGEKRVLCAPKGEAGVWVEEKELEQAHLVLGFDFPAATDAQRYAASILNVLLGGNMSSRLFQEIREKRGLAYSVYSSYSAFEDAGMLEIYAACAPEKVKETCRLMLAELEKLASGELPPEELLLAKSSLRSSLILSDESLDGNMFRLGRNELIFGKKIELDDVLTNIENITKANLAALAAGCLDRRHFSVQFLGPLTADGLDFI